MAHKSTHTVDVRLIGIDNMEMRDEMEQYLPNVIFDWMRRDDQAKPLR